MHCFFIAEVLVDIDDFILRTARFFPENHQDPADPLGAFAVEAMIGKGTGRSCPVHPLYVLRRRDISCAFDRLLKIFRQFIPSEHEIDLIVTVGDLRDPVAGVVDIDQFAADGCAVYGGDVDARSAFFKTHFAVAHAVRDAPVPPDSIVRPELLINPEFIKRDRRRHSDAHLIDRLIQIFRRFFFRGEGTDLITAVFQVLQKSFCIHMSPFRIPPECGSSGRSVPGCSDI